MKAYSLSSIVALAREGSPFYRKLYAHLPADPALSDLPVLDQTEFWSAHQRDRREVLTAPLTGGIVLNSGGTTGAPKFTYLYDEEWDSNVEISVGSVDAGLQDGDRVANLFSAGGLYASYLFATDLLRGGKTNALHLPIGSFYPIPDSARLIRELQVNVLMGIPTHLLKLIEHLENQGMADLHIRSIIYAGESFSVAQRAYLEKVFSGVEIHSAGYASVDVGAMAFADGDCAPGEHRVFDDATVLEILDDESGEPIEEAGRPGRIIFTSLTRRLMPIIRYPAGDRAVWLEPSRTPQRKFGLLGRANNDIRLANDVIIHADDLPSLLEPFREPCKIVAFQLLVTTEDALDCLTLRLVGKGEKGELAAGASAILEAFSTANPMFANKVANGGMRPARIEWISREELILSPRSAKTLTVVDRRSPQSAP